MFGLCKCGCGGKTTLWEQSYTKKGVKKGQPRDYIKGHQCIKIKNKATCHPDRDVKALGLCGSCYNASLFDRKPEQKEKALTARREQWAKKYAVRESEPYATKQKNRVLQHRYGISLAIYEQMHIEQQNCCAICAAPGGSTKSSRLYVDHNHTSGAARQLLCPKCNLDIGVIEQGMERIHALAAYLLKHEPDSEAWNCLARLNIMLESKQ